MHLCNACYTAGGLELALSIHYCPNNNRREYTATTHCDQYSNYYSGVVHLNRSLWA